MDMLESSSGSRDRRRAVTSIHAEGNDVLLYTMLMRAVRRSSSVHVSSQLVGGI